MAFPLETAQLRAQQRSYLLASSEKGLNSVLRIVKPLDLGSFTNEYTTFPEFRPVSPPIPFDLPDPAITTSPQLHNAHKRNSSRITARGDHVRRKSKLPGTRKKSQSNDISNNLISPQMTSMPVESLPPNGSETKKLKEYRNPLTKLFTRSERPQVEGNVSDSDSSLESIPNTSSDFAEDMGPAVDSYNDDDQSSEELEDSHSGALTLEMDAESGEELNSVDSAFTDIEGDSLADSSVNIMYDYTVPDTYVFDRDPVLKGPKQTKVGTSQAKGSATSTENVSKSVFSKLTPVLKRKESFIFQKNYDTLSTPQNVKSVLSDMIQMKHQSSNMNPLSYFSFANSNSDGVKQAKIDLFVPPKIKPVLKDLIVTTNVSIFDCIGFCLLRLFEANELIELEDRASLMDPNNWRMELIDEDGDLYDSNFGILDRTRLLSSYNSPRYLALCKAKGSKEIAANAKQTPLPLELKQNLDLYETRKEERLSAGEVDPQKPPTNLWDSAGNSIEVRVNNIPNSSSTKPISFFVASAMQVGGLLDLICRQYQADMSKYKLALLVKPPQGATSDLWKMENEMNRRRMPLDNSELLSDIESTDFVMIVDTKNSVRSMLDPKPKNGSLEAAITPGSATYLQGGITPKIGFDPSFKDSDIGLSARSHTGQAPDDSQSKDLKDIKDIKVPKNITKPNTSIEEFMTDANQLLPLNLNTIYFKWKVFRKKSPLLNRIEKSLILDGDYIHLAPTDDANWKKQPNDTPFSSSTQDASHHHHHYLHHYNYSKYYNDTMLKTSSFHISRITKLKQYKDSKTPTHFKIVIEKDSEQNGKETIIKKKYDLEAETVAQCEDIIDKIKWAMQINKLSNAA